jgi:hypothetical protein
MDLALAFGRADVAAFKRSLTERDLGLWQKYAEQRMLPLRRLELYLARLTLSTARGPVTEPGELKDYLFEYLFEREEITDEPDIDAMREAMGWGPR